MTNAGHGRIVVRSSGANSGLNRDRDRLSALALGVKSSPQRLRRWLHTTRWATLDHYYSPATDEGPR